MKLAIPVENNNMETKVNTSFGRAPFFLIYNTDTKESEFVENVAAQSSGGAGIMAAQIIVDNKVDALLTPRCGKNAAEVLKAADIKLYKSIDKSAKENIEAFNKEELSILNEIHEGHHGQGRGGN